MAFVLYKGPRVVKSWPVSISVAVDGGEVQKNDVFVDLSLLSKADLDKKIADLKAAGSLDVDADLLKSLVCGWAGIVDESGAPVEFSNAALADFVVMPNIKRAVFDAYYCAVGGEAAAKN